MKRVLSFGAGVQTTAMAIMVAKGELKVDAVVFADTGAEKPETYWYIENYIKPLLERVGKSLQVLKREKTAYYEPTLYDFLWRIKDIPSVQQRRCTDHYKIRVIQKLVGTEGILLIGFSLDEAYRANRKKPKKYPREYPLIDMGISVGDCRRIIQDAGFPLPLKSSCYFCPFQHPIEWNWLKNRYPDLFQKALDLEANYYERKPEMRERYGLLRGTPLWKMKDGLQPEMFLDIGHSCWSGHCGH